MVQYVYAKDGPHEWRREQDKGADFLLDQFRALVEKSGVAPQLHDKVKVSSFMDGSVPRLTIDTEPGDCLYRRFNRRQVGDALAYALDISQGCVRRDKEQAVVDVGQRSIEEAGYKVLSATESSSRLTLDLGGHPVSVFLSAVHYDWDNGSTYVLQAEVTVRIEGLPEMTLAGALKVLGAIREGQAKF